MTYQKRQPVRTQIEQELTQSVKRSDKNLTPLRIHRTRKDAPNNKQQHRKHQESQHHQPLARDMIDQPDQNQTARDSPNTHDNQLMSGIMPEIAIRQLARL
jgi:hypothetical protein